jgi:hypothetical protein
VCVTHGAQQEAPWLRTFIRKRIVTKKKTEAVTSYRDVVEAIAEDIRNNPEFEKCLDGTPPESLAGDVRAELARPRVSEAFAQIVNQVAAHFASACDSPESVDELYQIAGRGMDSLLGIEGDTVIIDLESEPYNDLLLSAGHAIAVWKACLEAMINLANRGFVSARLDVGDADRELSKLVSTLSRAQKVLAPKAVATS